MDLADSALLVAAGLAAGTVNAIAGGGSLITFPTLVAVGFSPVAANVTNSIAVSPGYVGSVLGSRADLSGRRRLVRRLLPTAAAGSAAGCALLLATPARAFEVVVPFLVLAATAVLAAQTRLRRLVGRDRPPRAAQPVDRSSVGAPRPAGTAATPRPAGTAATPRPAGTTADNAAGGPAEAADGTMERTADRAAAGQEDETAPGHSTKDNPGPAPPRRQAGWLHAVVFAGAVYGGYFGAALGVMLVAALGLVLDATMARVSALKNVISTVVGLTTVAVFGIFGPVDWVAVAVLAPATVVGGYVGARLARRLPAAVLRALIVAFGTVIGAVLLIRAF